MANVLEKIIGGGGVLPALASGKFGDENRGFALGLLPGMMGRNRAKKKADGTADMTPATTNTATDAQPGMKKGGKVKMAKGGYAKGGSASKRADGCAQRGKTRGKMV